jgi:hypothetical protein
MCFMPTNFFVSYDFWDKIKGAKAAELLHYTDISYLSESFAHLERNN